MTVYPASGSVGDVLAGHRRVGWKGDGAGAVVEDEPVRRKLQPGAVGSEDGPLGGDGFVVVDELAVDLLDGVAVNSEDGDACRTAAVDRLALLEPAPTFSAAAVGSSGPQREGSPPAWRFGRRPARRDARPRHRALDPRASGGMPTISAITARMRR
jgi:hypothetical protein